MPVYAPTPRFADQRRHPRALLFILGGHAALLAAVMTVRMDLPSPFPRVPTEVELIELPDPSPPEPAPRTEPRPRESIIDRPVVVLPVPPRADDPIDLAPVPLQPPEPGELIGPRIDPEPLPIPRADPVRIGPRFATPASKLKPPYPSDKLMREEETALRLKLSIDERGRVVAVEPVGRADKSFLEAARRHLIAHWRYQPATEDGKPVASSTVITLRFQLND